jgi:methionyl-tRNA formyltransferase
VCLAGSEPIGARESYGTLASRLQVLAGDLLVRVLDHKAEGRPLPFVEQDDSAVTYAEKIRPEDRLLDPALTAEELERRVRALPPPIAARAALPDGTLLTVREAVVARAASAGPGGAGGQASTRMRGVHAAGERLLLECSEGALELLVVQPPGGRAMDAASYLRGHRGALA